MNTQLTIYTPEQIKDAQSQITWSPPKLLPSGVARALAEQAQISDVMRFAIVGECHMLLAGNQPATPLQKAALIRRLMNHYRAPDMSDADMQGVIEDWLEDLGDMPFDILRDAMASYRQGPKANFKPMPGNIRELAVANAGYRMRLAERARETLHAIETWKERPAPPPDFNEDGSPNLPFETGSPSSASETAH